MNRACRRPDSPAFTVAVVLGLSAGFLSGLPDIGHAAEAGGELAAETPTAAAPGGESGGPASVPDAGDFDGDDLAGETEPAPTAAAERKPEAVSREAAVTGGANAAHAAAPQPVVPLRCRVKLEVTGHMTAPAGRDKPPVRQPITVDARFDFVETGVPAVDAPTVRRSYTDAVASLRIGGEEAITTLANDARRLLVVRLGTTPEPCLEDASLTAAERDLLSLPFDAVLLDDLLPRGAVAVGAAWEVPADLAAGLLAVDTIESGAIEARVADLSGGRGRMTLTGEVEGWVDGVPVTLRISGGFAAAAREADGEADDTASPVWRIESRVDQLSVVIRERRQAGHVAPGLDVEARLVVARTPVTDAAGGSPFAAPARAGVAVRAAAEGSPPDATAAARRRGPGGPGRVWFRDPAGRFDVVHDSRWRTVEDGPTGLVMRFVDRGALVGQCSIVAGASGDAPPSIAAVRSDIERSLEGQVTAIDDATEQVREDGVRIVRVVSSGAAAGLPFTWIHSVLQGPAGGRVDVTCMVQASMRERFAAADRDLVAGLLPGGEAERAEWPRQADVEAGAAPPEIREARTPGESGTPPAGPR